MVCILLKIPLPLGTMAILLTVLGTDVAPSLSLMYESCETDVMKLKPRNPAKEKLITSQYELTNEIYIFAIVLIKSKSNRLLTHVYLQVAVLQVRSYAFY